MDNKLRVGILGTWRGKAFAQAIGLIDEAEVTAICDVDPEKIEFIRPFCNENVKVCKDYDELLDSGIDAVILCNYFYEHTPFAVKALKKGIHVLSETLPAITLKECVELCEAVENSNATYAFAENYPFAKATMEIAKVYKTGILGEVTFAEGEYVHPMSLSEDKYYCPTHEHWRYCLPKTYYMTHALAPLMYATDLMPKKVIGKVAAGTEYNKKRGHDGADAAGIMLVEASNGAVFRISGSMHCGVRGNWYRLMCEKGEICNVPGTMDKVRLVLSEYEIDENSDLSPENVYVPHSGEMGKKAKKCGHYGGDFWVTYNFVKDILNGNEPYMNVYRAAAIAATGILGWRSALDDSKQLVIPDFRDKEAREILRSDDLCPFYIGDKAPSLPHTVYSLKDKAED